MIPPYGGRFYPSPLSPMKNQLFFSEHDLLFMAVALLTHVGMAGIVFGVIALFRPSLPELSSPIRILHIVLPLALILGYFLQYKFLFGSMLTFPRRFTLHYQIVFFGPPALVYLSFLVYAFHRRARHIPNEFKNDYSDHGDHGRRHANPPQVRRLPDSDSL